MSSVKRYQTEVFHTLNNNARYLYLPESPLVYEHLGRTVLLMTLIQFGPGEPGGLAIIDIESGDLLKVITLKQAVGFVKPTEEPGEVVIGHGLNVEKLSLTNYERETIYTIPGGPR